MNFFFRMEQTFIQHEWKNTRAYEKDKPSKGSPLKEMAPTVQNSTNRIITKALQNQNLKSNVKSNERPNIWRFPLQTLNTLLFLSLPKYPTR